MNKGVFIELFKFIACIYTEILCEISNFCHSVYEAITALEYWMLHHPSWAKPQWNFVFKVFMKGYAVESGSQWDK
jgi:hypothetical protein